MKKIVGMLLVSSLLLSNTSSLVVYATTDGEPNKESSVVSKNIEEQSIKESVLIEENEKSILSEEQKESDEASILKESIERNESKQILEEEVEKESSENSSVSTYAADITSPIIDLTTLKVSQSKVTLKDEVKVSVRVTDDIQVESVYISYIMPITNKPKGVYLSYNQQTELYDGVIEIDDTYETGIWRMEYISALDTVSNSVSIFNNQVYSWADDDLSSGNFNVYETEVDESYSTINKLENITVLNKSQIVNNQTINGDVYIGPKAVITFNNINITGSIYVLGALRANSISITGKISASNFSWGGNPTLYNGTVVLSGSNSIPSQSASSTPITTIPIRLDNDPLQSVDGYLSFKGATVDIAEMFVNDQLIDTSIDGKFIVDNLFTDDADEVTIKWNTIFGNTISKVFPIDKATKSETGIIHHKPMLEVHDLTFNLGDKIDLLSGVSANDQEDGNISDKVIVKNNTIDESKHGVYKVTYSITDSQGATVEKNISVTLKDPKIIDLSLSEPALSLNIATTYLLKAIITEQDNPTYKVNWSSSNEKVATVDDLGKVTAISPGKTIITVTVGDKKAESQVEVISELQSISLNKTKLELDKNQMEILKVSFTPSNTTMDKNIKWSSSNEKVAKVDTQGKVTAIDTGMATITAKVGNKEAVASVVVSGPSVSYSTHVQSIGWLDAVVDGSLSGTVGQKKRMEGIKINIKGNQDLGIQYSTHVQSYGWMNWVPNGALSGTSGKAKRLEAIKIKLTGKDAIKYDVYYRVHAEKNGWLGWSKNGEKAGTAGYGRRLEAIEIKLVEKGKPAPGTSTGSYVESIPTISYTTHVQKDGWQTRSKNGEMAGTSGQAKRLEGIKIKLEDLPYSGKVHYKTHVQSYGWQNWSANDGLSGTQGKAKRLEAIQIKLTGETELKYDVYYRVHAQNYGWLGWAKNGESAGTEGKSKRLEGIEIKLVKKGEKASGSTVNKFVK